MVASEVNIFLHIMNILDEAVFSFRGKNLPLLFQRVILYLCFKNVKGK